MGFLKHGSIQLYFCSVTFNFCYYSLVHLFFHSYLIKFSSSFALQPSHACRPSSLGRKELNVVPAQPFPLPRPSASAIGVGRREKEGDVVLTQLLVGGLSPFFTAHDNHSLV